MTEASFATRCRAGSRLEMQKLEAEMRARTRPRPPTRRGPGDRRRPERRDRCAADAAADGDAPRSRRRRRRAGRRRARRATRARPTAVAPAPPGARRRARGLARVALEEVDTPPRIATIVKPGYPPLALKARIGGIVVLRVLVSEKGPAGRDRRSCAKAPRGSDAKPRWRRAHGGPSTPAPQAASRSGPGSRSPIPFEPEGRRRPRSGSVAPPPWAARSRST